MIGQLLVLHESNHQVTREIDFRVGGPIFIRVLASRCRTALAQKTG